MRIFICGIRARLHSFFWMHTVDFKWDKKNKKVAVLVSVKCNMCERSFYDSR